MKLFHSDVSTHDGTSALAEPRLHQVIAAILTASPVALTERARVGDFDTAMAQSYLDTGSDAGDPHIIERLRKAACVDEFGLPRGPYLFTPATPDQANAIWQLTFDPNATDAFAFEVVSGNRQEAPRRDHHVFAYRDRGGHTSFLYVPRHGNVDIWHRTEEISADNFQMLHHMLSDLIEHGGDHRDLLLVLHEWLGSARDVWSRYKEAIELTAVRSTPSA